MPKEFFGVKSLLVQLIYGLVASGTNGDKVGSMKFPVVFNGSQALS